MSCVASFVGEFTTGFDKWLKHMRSWREDLTNVDPAFQRNGSPLGIARFRARVPGITAELARRALMHQAEQKVLVRILFMSMAGCYAVTRCQLTATFVGRVACTRENRPLFVANIVSKFDGLFTSPPGKKLSWGDLYFECRAQGLFGHHVSRHHLVLGDLCCVLDPATSSAMAG